MDEESLYTPAELADIVKSLDRQIQQAQEALQLGAGGRQLTQQSMSELRKTRDAYERDRIRAIRGGSIRVRRLVGP